MTESLFVSILMPIRNEATFIERSLGAVLAQDYPHDRMEVIVADGMSTDGTQQIVRTLQARHSNLNLIDNPGQIVSIALNDGFAQAQGDIIVWIGGHTEVAPDYVQRCVHYLENYDVDCVGGSIETIADTLEGQVIALAMSTPFGVGGVHFRTQSNRLRETDTVAFGAYRRSTMERSGPLDVELVRNQDDEYNYRLRELGGKILLAPDIHSRYYSRSSISSLCKQYYQYGFWKVRVMQKHPRQMRPRQFAPPAFAAALISSSALALLFPAARVLLGLIVSSYGLVNLTASVWTSRKHGWRHLPLLPVVFAALHLSYGLGFLMGLIRFANRWGDKQTRYSAQSNAPRGSTR